MTAIFNPDLLRENHSSLITKVWQRHKQTVLLWLSPLLLMSLWTVATSRGWVPPQIVPSPWDVWLAAQELYAFGELQMHLGASLWRLFFGFLLGASSGLIVGLLLATSPAAKAYLGLTFELFRHIPTLVLIPMLILLLGIGETLKIVIIVKAVFFPIAQATEDAINNINRNFIELGKVYKLKRNTLIKNILFPATVPPVLTGIRIALGRAWLVLVAVELLAADTGIGQMMEFARQMMRLDVVMVGVFITGIIGFGLDKGVRLIEARLMRWRDK